MPVEDRKDTIAFIICVNNELYFEECRYYIEHLEVSAGYDIDVIGIWEADSMCAAYNLGMRSSDAKYKVYMHQDVFIRDSRFLEKTLRIFKEHPKTLSLIHISEPTRQAEISYAVFCLKKKKKKTIKKKKIYQPQI